jgi:RimJ/RimL family protein N-acetyltransferase
MVKILETKRLVLRRYELDDAQFIVELVNSPGWIEFIGERNILTEESAIDYLLTGPMKSYKELGFGLSMVQLKDGTPVGMCGILKRESFDHPDLGFAFLPRFTGNGYALEIASATIRYAKEKFDIKTLLAITVPKNDRSIRLLEKLGFKFRRSIFVSADNKELMMFSSGK